MAGCVEPGLTTSRLKWAKVMVREVIPDGRSLCGLSDNRGCKSPAQFIRLLLKENHVKGRSRRISIREGRRPSSAEGVNNHLQSGGALKEAVGSLINQDTPIDSYNYVDVLRWCFKQKDFESVKQVHECVKKSGMEQNPYVANNLLQCYIACGRLQYAQELFSKLLYKNIVSWTTMIGGYAEHDQAVDAIELYKRLRSEGEQANPVTYLTVLKACATPKALNWGKAIHAHIIDDGFQADVRVCNALVHMYIKCGSIEDAREVFDRMERRSVISWNTMIGGLAHLGHGFEAFSLFQQMQREGFTPNSVTYLSILSAKAEPRDLTWVKEVHSHATESGLALNLSLNNAFIRMYTKCGSMDDAKSVFDSLMTRDIFSWNALIGGLARHGCGYEAFSCFHQMQSQGFVPDAATYVNILNSNAGKGALAWVKEVHRHATRSASHADLRVNNALIHMYAESGSIEDARAVFDSMEERDVISWNAIIGGLVKQGPGHEAFSLFVQMQGEGFTPNAITYLSLLNPYSSPSVLEWVKVVHTHAVRAGLEGDLRVRNALIHTYAKIGNIADARHVFDKMQDRNVVSWTAMIGGLAQHGHGREALQLFGKMNTEEGRPNVPLFVSVLSACNHAGLVDEGRFQFVSMMGDYGIQPTLEHYNCLVDILGRAGHLEESKLFILNMPVKPDIITWKTLLGACRIYNSTKLAELAAKECLKLDPMDDAPYVLLSNIYAADGSWDQASLIRNMMDERGIRKDPGRCWVEGDDKVHQFVAGDTSHPDAEEI